MLVKNIIYFIVMLVISASYPTYAYMKNNMPIIDAITTTVIIFVVLHILYKINTRQY